MKSLIVALLFATAPVYSQQWVLQPWVEVFGSTPGERLGRSVTGLHTGPGFPYRAGVFRGGKTYLYRLDNAADTASQVFLPGGDLMQGDLDGDGINDYVLRKEQDSVGVDSILVFRGTITGVDSIPIYRQAAERRSDELDARCIGDLDGDGVNDLVIADFIFGYTTGKVYIVWGPIQQGASVTTFLGDSSRFSLGWSGVIGDFNSDGKNDLVIGGELQTNTPADFNYINIYWGTGTRSIDSSHRLQIRTRRANQHGLACIDVNADGRKDLLWATLDSARAVSIYFGRSDFRPEPDLQLRDPGVGHFGFQIVDAGDMNGDGYNDIAVGCPQADYVTGLVFVFSGGPSMNDVFDAAVGKTQDSDFGYSLASLGDVTGDGLADLIVGRPRYDFGKEKGYWAVFKGSRNIPVPVGALHAGIPAEFVLGEPYPNPFNPTTTVPFTVAVHSQVTLTLYDALGRRIETLLHEEREPGSYITTAQGSSLASGVYFIEMKANAGSSALFTATKKVVIAK